MTSATRSGVSPMCAPNTQMIVHRPDKGARPSRGPLNQPGRSGAGDLQWIRLLGAGPRAHQPGWSPATLAHPGAGPAPKPQRRLPCRNSGFRRPRAHGRAWTRDRGQGRPRTQYLPHLEKYLPASLQGRPLTNRRPLARRQIRPHVDWVLQRRPEASRAPQ